MLRHWILCTVIVLFLAHAPPSVAGESSVLPSPEVPLAKADLGYLVLGIIFVTLGLVALLVALTRPVRRDAALHLFGAMSCAWGGRFLLYTRLVPLLATGDPHALQRLARALTYFSAAAAFGFAWAFLGAGLRSSLRALAYVALAFACAASVVLVINPNRDLLLPAFNVMVLAGAAVVILNVFHKSRSAREHQRFLVSGLSIGLLFFVLENLRALGLVPVPFDVEWIGVLTVYVTLGGLTTMRMFDNERRLAAIRQELATARRIQASLLPRRTPEIADLSIAARFLPMNDVAGDIYDFVPVDHCRLGILVADVSGHGTPAALIASMVKGAFRAQVERIERPAHVFSGMNRILTGQLEREFVTASCTYIDTEKGVLRYSAAGHPPLLIQQENDDCVQLERNGLVLGPFPDAPYSSIERALTTGERLLLYTDGLLEATDADGRQFGEGALQDFLARGRHLPAERFADALLAAVRDWGGPTRGGGFEDDLTLIVIDVGDVRASPATESPLSR